MTTYFQEPKQHAKALRAALKELHGVELTHGQALDLIARSEGSSNWNALHAEMFKTWAYRRHEAYLPHTVTTVRSLSVKQAVRDELFADDNVELFELVSRSLQRMFWQINMARHNALQVEPELRACLAAAMHQPLIELQMRERSSAQALQEFLTEHPTIPMSALNASRYSSLYVDWRLDTLALALARTSKKPTLTLVKLLQSHQDVYSYIGCLALGADASHLDEGSDMDLHMRLSEFRKSHSNERCTAKATMLAYVSGQELCDVMRPGMPYVPNGVEGAEQVWEVLDQHMPELRLWHAWVELKSLLAEGADEVYRDRTSPEAATA